MPMRCMLGGQNHTDACKNTFKDTITPLIKTNHAHAEMRMHPSPNFAPLSFASGWVRYLGVISPKWTCLS